MKALLNKKEKGVNKCCYSKFKLLTLSPVTVGRSVSGELAVILCAAITPRENHRQT